MFHRQGDRQLTVACNAVWVIDRDTCDRERSVLIHFQRAAGNGIYRGIILLNISKVLVAGSLAFSDGASDGAKCAAICIPADA